MEWSHEAVLEFLEHYENEPVIWDPKTPHHKDRNAIYDAWRRIQDKMTTIKVNVSELKKKKDALMATFRKLSCKIKYATSTGNAVDDVSRPDWFAYERMMFLFDIYKPRALTCSEETKNSNDSYDTLQETNTDEEIEEPKIYVEKEVPKNSQTHRKRRIQQSPETTNRSSDSPMQDRNRHHESDECGLYCNLLAKKLRSLNESQRDLAMLEIDKALFQVKYQNPANFFTPSSNSILPHGPNFYNSSSSNPVPVTTVACPSSSSADYQLMVSPSLKSSPLPSPTNDVTSGEHYFT